MVCSPRSRAAPLLRSCEMYGEQLSICRPQRQSEISQALPCARPTVTLGGIFVAGARDLRLLVGAGDRAPSGAMILRFSERVAIDDEDGIAFGAYLGEDRITREAVLRTRAGGSSRDRRRGSACTGWRSLCGFPGCATLPASRDSRDRRPPARTSAAADHPPVTDEMMSEWKSKTQAAAGPYSPSEMLAREGCRVV